MGRRTRGFVAAAVVVVLVGALAPTVAAAPNLSVTVDRAAVGDGETITVTDDPRIGMEISADATIESVEVRVDGQTRQTFSPGSASFSDSVILDLDDGDNEVTVVATASGRVEHTVTVRKDSDGPRVSYTSPFETDVGRPGSTVQIGTAKTTLAGDLRDLSGIQIVRIERTYRWTFAGQSERSRRTYRLESPGENFSQPLLFGVGENDLKVELVDVHGQRTTHQITVTVVDDAKPSIDLDRFEREGDTLRVAGVVSDNVKVRSFAVRTPSGRKSVLTETSKEPTEERLSAEFEFPARISENTEEITLIATDVAGNTREWTVPVDYRGHLVPTVTIDPDATTVGGDGVAVSGLVSDGRVTQVVVETVGPDGAVVASTTAYEGEATDRVPIQARLGRADGETTVVVRAVDVDGREHQETLRLATSGGETTTQAESTPAATAAPSTAVPETAAPVRNSRPTYVGPTAALLDAGANRLPVPMALPFPAAIPLPFPLAGTGLVVALLGLVMGLSSLGDRTGTDEHADERAPRRADETTDRDPSAGSRASDPAVGGGGAADRRSGGGGAADGRSGDSADAPVTGDRTAGRQSTESARDASAGGRQGTDGRPPERAAQSETGGGPPASGAEPSEEPPSNRAPERESGAESERPATFDVTDHLGVASMEAVDEADVASLVDALDDDDTEAVVTAIRGLEAVGVDRPDLLEGTEAEERLRDRRLAPDPAVSDAASRAVRRLTDD
jgi:hypothetical protein